MAKREVFNTYTFEEQRKEINLLSDDVGDKEELNTLSVSGQESVVNAINEVIDTPIDDVFVDEIANTDSNEQRIVFSDESSFIPSADYTTTGQKLAGTNPEGLDFTRLKYDYGSGTDANRFTYNSNNKLLRVNNVKSDLKNRNNDGNLNSPGQTILSVGTDYDSTTQTDTALYTGRLQTKALNPPVEIQQRLIKLQEQAKILLENGSQIELKSAIDSGAYINVTNNKKIIYVSVDDENASDLASNDGSNINRPFKTIERALIEASKRSYVGAEGPSNISIGIEENEPGADLFENFTILLFPGEYVIDNTPGLKEDGTPYTFQDISEETFSGEGEAYESSVSFADEFKKFNPIEGGLIVPRGTSIVGLDLRKTLIRPKYVPDPANDEIKRCALFRLTGACYIWQFTIKDNKSILESHHKLTAFEYANVEQLEEYYKKIDKYSRKDDGNSLGGRFLDAQDLLLKNKQFIAQLAVARTELTNSGFNAIINDTTAAGDTRGQACADDTALLIEQIAYNLAYGGNDRVYDAAQFYIDNAATTILGEEQYSIDVFNEARDICNEVVCNVTVDVSAFSDPSLNYSEQSGFKSQVFDYTLIPDNTVNSEDNTDPNNCSNVRSSITTLWAIITTTVDAIDLNPATAEVSGTRTTPEDASEYNQRIEENRIVGFVQNKYLSDTVASASPYVFNISLRSVWGMCGLLADGAQSTGLRSMVLAQFTGISLQRDDRAFLLNGSTTTLVEDPDQRHSVSTAEYKNDWRHFHVKSTNNSFLQIVSVFAVGQADHFTTETGADNSITNSNSNFGNSSLISISHRSEIFSQDNGAYIVGLVPPRGIDPTKETKINLFDVDFEATLNLYDVAEKTGQTEKFKKIYVKVNGQNLIKESDIPEYYSIIPGSKTAQNLNGVEQAELVIDNVNYLLGKREYDDGFPEAIYSKLPKNYTDSTLQTFAARLRTNESISDNNLYDPKSTYSEGIIIRDQYSNSSQPAPSISDLSRPIKNFYVVNEADTDPETNPDFITSLSNLSTNETHFGTVVSGLNSSAKFKVIVGSSLNTFDVAILDGSIRSVAIEGRAWPVPSTETVTYRLVPNTTATPGEIQYTYTGRIFPNTNQQPNNGSGATFDLTRVQGIPGINDSGYYIVELVTSGLNYDIGDTITIRGDLLGGVSGLDPVGHVITTKNLSGGSGYTVGTTYNTSGGDGSSLTVKVISIDDLGAPTEIEVVNGGSGYTEDNLITITGGSTSATFEVEYIADGLSDNDLTIHIIENSNSGQNYRRNANNFLVSFSDITVSPATSFTARILVTDVVLPQGVILNTNDLYDFDSLSGVNYTIPSNGYDAKYYLGLDANNVLPWQAIGQADLTTTIAQNSSFNFIRILGGSGFTDEDGFNTIRVPGSYFGGIDGSNDLSILIPNVPTPGVGGATISTKNYNSDQTTAKRRFYGWEFARTIDGEYYGRLCLLIDDERNSGFQNLYGVPTDEFDPITSLSGVRFSGFTQNTIVGYPATATVRGNLPLDREIASITITNQQDSIVEIVVDSISGKPRSPFYIGDQVELLGTSDSSGLGQNINGTYRIINVTDTIPEDGTVLTLQIPNITGTWSSVGTVRKRSKEITVPVKVNITGALGSNANEGEITGIFPNDYDYTLLIQNTSTGWSTSGSKFSYDDIFDLNFGVGTSLITVQDPALVEVVFQAFELQTIENKFYTSAEIKEFDYLPGNALGVRYNSYDTTSSLENNTVEYNPANYTVNENLSLFKRITQRVDTNSSGTLETIDGFEFNKNTANTLFMLRVQDTRSSNGNSELLWRLIVKLPKEGYNNIRLRSPEERFVIHLKDGNLRFNDDTIDYPFVYDHGEIGNLRKVKIVPNSFDTIPARANQTLLFSTINEIQYIKSKKKNGDGVTYIPYQNYSNSIGADTLSPSGGAFEIKYNAAGNPENVIVVDQIIVLNGNFATTPQKGDTITIGTQEVKVSSVDTSSGTRLAIFLSDRKNPVQVNDLIENLGTGGSDLTVTSVSSLDKCYTEKDRIILDDRNSGELSLQITKCVTTHPRSLYVQNIETIVEYEYNKKDGYYLLTVLDGNIYKEYNNSTGETTLNDYTITYGKQRLIGFEDIDPVDGITSEINHLKQDASDLIEKNKLFIQLEAHGYLENKYPNFYTLRPELNPERCKRDIGYLLNGIVDDLRLGGNNHIIDTAQYYFANGTSQFIDTEIPQSLETFRYAKNLAILAARNWNTFILSPSNASSGVVRVPYLDGIVEGMAVYQVSGYPTTNAQKQTILNAATFKGYTGNINYDQTPVSGTYSVPIYNNGVQVNNISGSNNVYYYFVLENGYGLDWIDHLDTPQGYEPIVDTTVIEDFDYVSGKCANSISAINVLHEIFQDILSAKSSEVIVTGDRVAFEDTAGILSTAAENQPQLIRVFGANTDALNGDSIEATYNSLDQVFEYNLPIVFTGLSFNDNIVYYKNDNSVEYTQPTKASYVTKQIVLEGFGLSQNINYLYPEVDFDNPKWNALPSKSEYRKDVGNVIIRDNKLDVDGYQRISQYSITAESTKELLNSILTGGTGSTGFSNRTFAKINLNNEFGTGQTIDDAVMQNPYLDDEYNKYGIDKSPVLQFTENNVPIFTNRCIIFDSATPISLYRPSIIRASSHTWEYVGYGPGNYSTGLPQFQDITLTQQQIVNSQTVERGAGFCASSGTNSIGDFYIGNQIIDATGNESNTLNFPKVRTSTENRLITYDNLDSLAANTSTSSFNPSSFSPILTESLQAIQESQRNSFKASNVEASILTAGTVKINNKISISNNVFENTNNFPEAKQDEYGFTRRASLNWFNIDPNTNEYNQIANSYISPTDINDWANAKSLVPSSPVNWEVTYVSNAIFNEVSNVGRVDINLTLTKSSNFNVEGIDSTDTRWYDPVTSTLSLPLGTPTDLINNTNLNNYEGRSGQIFVNFPSSPVKVASIIPTNIWVPVENTWTGVSQVDGSATTYLQGNQFIISYYISAGKIVYTVNTLEN